MRISDWSSDVCSSDLAPQTERFWARISPYAGGLRYNASTPANKRGNRVNITTPGETMRVLRSALLALALLPLVAVAQQSPTGRWKTIDDETGKVKSIVEITQAADGTLQGKDRKSPRLNSSH